MDADSGSVTFVELTVFTNTASHGSEHLHNIFTPTCIPLQGLSMDPCDSMSLSLESSARKPHAS